MEGPSLAPLLLLLVVGGALLLLVGNHRRARRESGATLAFAAGAALVLSGVGAFAYIDIERNTVDFRYTVTLTPNGTGQVRVSLPAPVDEALLANLAPSPSSSSVTMNRTGSEPAIDVILTGPTTLTASFSAYRYTGPADLTRMDSLDACSYSSPPNECRATVSVFVISGNITTVHVHAQAYWNQWCYSPLWELDALALPGEQEYAAAFVVIVC